MNLSMENKAQVSAEYLLLVALGLVIIIAGVTLAMKANDFANVVSSLISNEANQTISMISS
ncbi:MAG: hypothetical protein M1594_02150 [Candidatus Marsarchaeota archaeon]|nr:hypothetical protein [Candidatus Marsarchaeota archaeon]